MSQEDKETYSENESGTGAREENLSPEELAINVNEQADSQAVDNLPIESIGSYAKLEELLTDEEKENTSNPTAQS
jgi:hypothetical protein